MVPCLSRSLVGRQLVKTGRDGHQKEWYKAPYHFELEDSEGRGSGEVEASVPQDPAAQGSSEAE